MSKFRSLVLSTIALSFLFPALSMAQAVKIGTFPIPLMVESKESGIFIDLVKELAKRANVQIEIEVFPPTRAIEKFSKKEIVGIFPSLDVTNPGPVAKSSPIYTKVDYVFYRKDNPLKSMGELEGKTVGLTLGYPYVKELTDNTKIKFDYANDDLSNLKKLAAGRIDAFVVEEKTGMEALKKSGLGNIEHSPGSKISEQLVYFAFQDNPEGKGIAEKFSKALDAMKADGSLKALMSKAQ